MIHPDIIEREGKEYYSKEYMDRIIRESSKINFMMAVHIVLKHKIEIYLTDELISYYPVKGTKTDEFVTKIFENIKEQIFEYYESMNREHREVIKQLKYWKKEMRV